MATDLTFAQERAVSMALKIGQLRREHQAALARAWDEGYQAREEGTAVNPYREEARTG